MMRNSDIERRYFYPKRIPFDFKMFLLKKNLFPYIYIFIAFALDESIILDVPQMPMKNIYQSCDLGRAIGWSNVNAIQ